MVQNNIIITLRCSNYTTPKTGHSKKENKEKEEHMENKSETKTIRQKKFIPAEKMGDHLQDQKRLRKIQAIKHLMQRF